MRQDYEKPPLHLEPSKPPAGLFGRILLAIKREQELRKTKRLAFGFLALLLISLSAAPFSIALMAEQIENSGTLYFVAMINDLGNSLVVWREFALAVAESLPVTGIAFFTVNMIVAVFTLRLFLHRKKLLLDYLLSQAS